MRAIPTSAFAAVSIASHTFCAHLADIIAPASIIILPREYRTSRPTLDTGTVCDGLEVSGGDSGQPVGADGSALLGGGEPVEYRPYLGRGGEEADQLG